MTGSTQIIQADSRHLPIEDNTVDLVVTSPPYFGLRSYQDGGEHYEGQVGDEATPQEFIAALLEVTRECVRVLKPSGSLWVNLGDKYASSTAGTSNNGTGGSTLGHHKGGGGPHAAKLSGTGEVRRIDSHVPTKSLIGIPWRYALACIDQLGLILRAEVIWSKPNGLPESVTDRVRRSHETWFHLTLEPRYYSAVDEVRVAAIRTGERRPALAYSEGVMPGKNGHDGLGDRANHPLGSLPGSVWEIPTQPLKVPAHLGVDHFAAFPMEWPRRIIKGWSPAGVCTACREGRRPVSDAARQNASGLVVGAAFGSAGRHGTADGARHTFQTTRTITGEVCGCSDETAPTTPGVVLDPFGGTGTTALVAKALGRHGISVDMSADYCRLAEWRTTDPGELARAMQVDKPPVEMDDQLDIFGGVA